MLQNYFFLNRFLLEIKSSLEDSKIEEVFSQEKSKLVIVTSRGTELYFLELCVTPGNSYMNLRNNYSRARKNTVNFFDVLIGEKITSLEIADNDRVIKIKCTNSNMFFTIRGKFTNIFYLDEESNLFAFKTIKNQNLLNMKKEFDGLTFIDGWNALEIMIENDEELIEKIKKSS